MPLIDLTDEEQRAVYKYLRGPFEIRRQEAVLLRSLLGGARLDFIDCLLLPHDPADPGPRPIKHSEITDEYRVFARKWLEGFQKFEDLITKFSVPKPT